MDNQKFMDTIHAPYNEAWKLIKAVKDLRSMAPEDEKAWLEWNDSIEAFEKKYHDNDFALAVYRMLLDAGDVIGKING